MLRRLVYGAIDNAPQTMGICAVITGLLFVLGLSLGSPAFLTVAAAPASVLLLMIVWRRTADADDGPDNAGRDRQ
jgi:membrane protein implicated in regulation of membrane protease activity